MHRAEKCTKCGCIEIVHRVMVAHDGQRGEANVGLRLDADPTAMFLKKSVRSIFHAEVCSACGYVEFYAHNPAELLAAFRDAPGPAK